MILRGLALGTVLLAGAASAQPPAPTVPPGMQWLYGSGEGGASSIQAYHAFRDYVLEAARRRSATGRPRALNRSEKSPSWSPAMAITQ